MRFTHSLGNKEKISFVPLTPIVNKDFILEHISIDEINSVARSAGEEEITKETLESFLADPEAMIDELLTEEGGEELLNFTYTVSTSTDYEEILESAGDIL